MFTRIWDAAKDRLNGDRGASLVEYALLVALIAVVAIIAINAVGSNVSDTLNSVANSL